MSTSRLVAPPVEPLEATEAKPDVSLQDEKAALQLQLQTLQQQLSQEQQVSTGTKVAAVSLATFNGYAVNLGLNIVAPMIPGGVGDAIQWLKDNYWMAHATTVSFLGGMNSRAMLASMWPKSGVDVNKVMRFLNHGTASFVSGVGGNYLLFYTMGEEAIGPSGMAALAGIQTVATPLIGKGLDKLTHAVAPTVARVASVAKNGMWGCMKKVAQKASDFYHRNDAEHRGLLPH